jgi:hypothetical protein
MNNKSAVLSDRHVGSEVSVGGNEKAITLFICFAQRMNKIQYGGPRCEIYLFFSHLKDLNESAKQFQIDFQSVSFRCRG